MRINVGFSLSHENFCVLFQFSFPTPLFFFFFFLSDISTTLKLSGCVWQWSGLDRSKKFLLKSIAIFLLSILHQSFFIIIQIKKSLQNKNFHFFVQNILTFFLTSIKYATIPVYFPKSIHLPNITSMLELFACHHQEWAGHPH
jgi:hypothetical protein